MQKTMTKKEFYTKIAVSSAIAVSVIIIAILFCISMFFKYTSPNGENTYRSYGTVTEVYEKFRRQTIVIVFDNGQEIGLISPGTIGKLYKSLGYDYDELAAML